jgi:hypothetical protein
MKRITSILNITTCRRPTSLVILSGLALAALSSVIFGCSQPQQDTESSSAVPVSAESHIEADKPSSEGRFAFPRVDPNHDRMTALLENAFGYIAPDNGIVDPASGYPVEGWNHDPERGLFLRSFTQLTAIGQWIEVLANIAAGHADNPYISRDEALERLAFAVKNLRHDQHDPKVSAMGLLGNFLGLEGEKRTGPLSRDVAKQDVVDAFGEEKGAAIWEALKEEEWIKPENQDQSGVIQRDEEYGLDYFEGALEPFGDDETKKKLMEIMDERIVMVAYGDNANLASSVAKAIGALLSPEVHDNPAATELREEMERFLDDQKEGYEFLFDEKAGMLSFGWNASTDKYFGWEDLQGNWTIGHSDYLVNEFRGPTMFVLLRYAMPEAIVANLGFKIKPYRLLDGELVHTLAPWEGSAFQALGLSLAMGELEDPNWKTTLNNVVDIELDYADRHALPGLLSESYSGDGTEYTGSIGIPEITVSPKPRITDAPSLYTLGVAYSIAPAKVERLLDDQWEVVTKLMTDHGPWEGYNTTTKEVIDFQTSAHVLSFILGGLGTASENMARYLDSKRLGESLQALYKSGERVDFLSQDKQVLAWSPDGSIITSSRDDAGFHLQGDDAGEVGITLVLPGEQGVNLSGGLLTIRYTAKVPVDKVVIKLDKKDPALYDAGVILSEIFTNFAASDGQEREMKIPLPATPGLAGIKEVVILCGSNEKRAPVDLSIAGFEFEPVVKE